jgi:hypothetical protein
VAFVFLIVYFFFVETAGPTLEELTYLFEGEGKKQEMVAKMHDVKEDEDRVEVKQV